MEAYASTHTHFAIHFYHGLSSYFYLLLKQIQRSHPGGGPVAGDFVKLELVLVRGSLSLLFNRRAFVGEEAAGSPGVRFDLF